MRLWHVELFDSDEVVGKALVLAPDAEHAREVALTDDLGLHWGSPLRAGAAQDFNPVSEVIVVDLIGSYEQADSTGVVDGPVLWKVPHNDGLFHRSPGVSLVAAPDAISALRLAIAEDPFEGQPPYGVPPAYGPVERFVPTRPARLLAAFD